MITDHVIFYFCVHNLSLHEPPLLSVFFLHMYSSNLMFFFNLQILAGLLQLGNVNFSSSTDDSQPCNLDEESKGIAFSNTLNLLEY